eukprot:jgi/Mesvir1/13098/Mv06077-RA.1
MSEKKKKFNEADFTLKAGNAWSHNFLNQKTWHPLSYQNQKRKWIAEQEHAVKERFKQQRAKEFEQELEFFRNTEQLTGGEKESVRAKQSLSFMYQRPPGYDAVSASQAKEADEAKEQGLPVGTAEAPVTDESIRPTLSAMLATPDCSATGGDPFAGGLVVRGNVASRDSTGRLQARTRDVFGRAVATSDQFPILKNAPRHDVGDTTAVRPRPFALELRNVRCLRCGMYGHSSGDRECPMKGVNPADAERQQREDPLAAVNATLRGAGGSSWELKQTVGLVPARGGYKPTDENQQILAPDPEELLALGEGGPGGAVGGTPETDEIFAQLTEKQKKKLLKIYKSEKKKERKEEKKRRKVEKRKEKKRSKHEHRSSRKSSSSSSSSSSSDDE